MPPRRDRSVHEAAGPKRPAGIESPSRVAVAVLVAILGCAPLDRRPPHHGARFSNALSFVERAGKEARGDFGVFEAGWSRVEIELRTDTPLAGFAARDSAEHRGVRDPSYVRAFAMKAGEHEVLLFTADLLLLDPETSEAIRQSLANELDPAAVFFTASHTHSGPGGYASGFVWELVFGDYGAEHRKNVVRAHVEAARRARAALEPVSVGSAEIWTDAPLFNRIERGGPVDRFGFVLRFETRSGRRAALWSFGCHPVLYGAESLQVSADYPGMLASRHEGRDMELLAFASGGVGSVEPPKDQAARAQMVDDLDRALSIALDRAKASATTEASLSSAQLALPSLPLRYRVSDDLSIPAEAVSLVLDLRSLSMGAIAIDDTLLLHLPAEISGELSASIRRQARRRELKLGVFPFNGTYAGYVVSRRAYELPEGPALALHEYETRTLAFLGPWGGDLLLQLGARLLDGVRAAAAQGQRRRTSIQGGAPRTR